jgi:two-component system, OmpR family, alkaline phosphatase synthesis response regulator PhoP
MKADKFKILLVDDDKDIIEFLTYNLEKEGYNVYSASNGINALKIAKDKKPHLIILDVMMPEMDGIETCNELRKVDALQDTIITFLTARGEDYSQIVGFDAGADDYIVKPIKPKVLLSRVKALLRRKKSSDIEINEIIEVGEIIIDRDKHIVRAGKEKFSLPKKEFELLLFLVSNKDRVLSRDQILSKIWGDDIIVGDRTIDVHIRKLREKIGNDYIKTIKGFGYKFEEL